MLDLFFGEPGFPAPGLSAAAADLTFISPLPTDQDYGASVAFGDLTGDGFDEIAIGAPYNATNGPESGAVYVYCGGPAMDTVPDVIVYGPPNTGGHGGDALSDEGQNIGQQVATGDLNGDGIADLVVFGYASGTVRSEAFAFLGGASFCAGAPRILQTETEADALARIRASEIGSGHLALGDPNGDGLMDIAIMDTGYHISSLGLPTPPDFSTRGAVFVFYSAPSLPPLRENADADVRFAGGDLVFSEDDFDSRVSLYRTLAFGDLDGDGYEDLAVNGEIAPDDPGDFTGVEPFVFVFYGGPALPPLVYATDADARIEASARHLLIGDPDGDGTNDLLVLRLSGGLLAFSGGARFPAVLPQSARAYLLPALSFFSPIPSIGVLTNVNGGACPGLGIGDPSFNANAGRAQLYTCAAEDTTPPDCGPIVLEHDSGGRLTAVASSASDPESGIASVTFTRLRNLHGFIDGAGPFSEGNRTSFMEPLAETVSFRGERISFSQGGALVVRVTNGAGLSSNCDPVVSQLSATVPEAFALEPAFPNPSRGAVTFRFALAEPGPVTLSVYDVAGREVARLVEGELAPGRYEAVWGEAGDLASGAYVLHLQAGGQTLTQRITLVR